MARQSAPTLDQQQLVSLYRQALLRGISLDSVQKRIDHKVARTTISETVEEKEERNRVKEMRRGLPKAVRLGALLVPVVFIGVGLLLMGNALVPIGQYYATSLKDIGKNSLIPPIPREEVLDVTPFVMAQTTEAATEGSVQDISTGPVILDTELDYTNLTNWFAEDRSGELQVGTADEYTIDIPKIKIKNAKVKVGGTDLSESLISYPGTAMPGDSGAPVIFGHSVLRQFYNPSEQNPRRYTSIFSYIMTLQPGDSIMVTKEGVTYKYVVRTKTEVKPEDTYILAQQYDNKLLKLVTCTPEGTYARRGVITAELVAN
jgi:sortase A